jgi:transposase
VHAVTRSPLALATLQRTPALSEIEATIHRRPPHGHLAARNAQSAPLFSELRAWPEKTRAPISGKSDMAGAIRYPEWRLTVYAAAGGSGCLQRCGATLRRCAGA